jgi:enamine deaminase RidA (YjgF/YER057c/UK114 family)
VALYAPFVEAGGLLHVSGQLPYDESGELMKGKLGQSLSVDGGRAAARACGLMLLAQVSSALNGLERVQGVVKLNVFVNSTADFVDQPQVANGASQVMQEALGERGRHARSAVGVAGLPLGVAVEVDGVFQIAPA